MECIVLAGGLGTRLQHIVPDVPKCLAPVNGQPFLAHLFHYLEQQYCDHVILSLGYKYEMVLEWLKTKAFTFKISWVIEKEPLGTGGGLKRALLKCHSDQCFVLNGDTLFDIPLREMSEGLSDEVKAVIALKPMQQFERYGTVILDEDQYITGFREKQACDNGLINGGIYLLNHAKTLLQDMPDHFSLEKDFFEPEADQHSLKGYINEGYFIDIGVEEDYLRAQKEIGQ
ncbi:nucleotidyltransferase family protein [Edaphocola flava]|jgi:D-glycero-alpha-D-manno-heptose 1-phosphate guanylyltransferase|uniref:nucleotidyltransferase family protein n=1 Tax=Edaphocola flava TaxID=2499629 RepID=UPI00100A2301|nr:nucleotidyltransferase family protein [Edaphocola flava]